MLNLKSIRKDYVTSSEVVHALRGVSVAFRKSEFVSILGPSGCGKTTLLNIIGGLDHYTDGDLVINGRSTKSYTDRDWDVYRNHRIGFIFQSYNLIPHQTVLGNVELALTIAGIGREERIERAKRALDRVGLSDQYYKKPNQLSGGQCQRVAIARALVNDPEILLADEPTGALDTVTSVQIMDLIKEISNERLVIMVTHNPELAEQYSSRIIRLLDGNVIEDSDPFSSEDEELECAKEAEEACNYHLAEEKAEITESSDDGIETPAKKKKVKKEKAKMSFFTAFMLSARNLLSKKGRTAMVGFAGSIGIIGIAMVLAFSSGIKGYIASMQDDMLSGNPISITETAYDLDALTGMIDEDQKIEIIKQPNRVYISSLIAYLAKMDKTVNTIMVENELTKEYIDFVKAMPSDYYNAMLLKYGIDLNNNIYTEFKAANDAEPQKISVSALTSMYTAILKETQFKDYASYVTALAPSMSQLPNNRDYILSQYDLVGEGSRFAENKNEIMLVLDSNDELSDLLLARFGYYTQEEFLEIIDKETDESKFNEEIYRDSFAYDELLGKTMMWYSNDTVFKKVTNPFTNQDMFTYKPYSSEFEEDGTELKVVGILTPKENISYGSISSGIYYTEDLTNTILEKNANSEIFDYINSIPEDGTDSATAMYSYYFSYTFDYVYDSDGDGVAESKKGAGAVGPAMTMEDMMGSMTGTQGSTFDHKEMKERLIRTLGGNNVANSVYIYPVSFDNKDLVTDYLRLWNSEDAISYNGVTIQREDRTDVTFTDTLELVINLINTMIDVVSYALIAFTSISLVVSTVMIGIITYVSVVERIKEIGVIRALGGRKKDVSHLFNAETFIIGLLAGILGVSVTYLISVIVNVILKPLIGYSSIADLPISNAILLIIISVLLTLVSGLIPAKSAANKDPVVALRTE